MPSDKAMVHVIDDDEAVRKSLTFLLATAGMGVKTYELRCGIPGRRCPVSRQAASSPT